MSAPASLLPGLLAAAPCAALFACGSEIQLGPGPYADEVRADSPSLYLRLGERSGAVAADDVGEYAGRYPATEVTFGEPGAIVGDESGAVGFGGGSVVTMPSGLDFAGASAFSVELWAKPSAYDEQSGYGFVVDHQSYDPRIGYALRVSRFDVAFERWAGGTTFGSNATLNRAVSLGEWHHVVATFDGSNLELFVDGASVASNGVPSDMPAVTSSWSVGGPNCECSSNYFVGALDELAIYDHALGAARVRAHHDAAGRPAPGR